LRQNENCKPLTQAKMSVSLGRVEEAELDEMGASSRPKQQRWLCHHRNRESTSVCPAPHEDAFVELKALLKLGLLDFLLMDGSVSAAFRSAST